MVAHHDMTAMDPFTSARNSDIAWRGTGSKSLLGNALCSSGFVAVGNLACSRYLVRWERFCNAITNMAATFAGQPVRVKSTFTPRMLREHTIGVHMV